MKQRPIYSYPIDEVIQKRWSPRVCTDTSFRRASAHPAGGRPLGCILQQPATLAFYLVSQRWLRKYQKLLACLADGNRAWAQHAPVLIMVLNYPPYKPCGPRNQWALYDLGLAVGNLTTQASLMDLYVHNMAGFDEAKVRELFEIDAEMSPVTMLTVGHLGDISILNDFNQKRELQVQVRKPLDELILF